jgi:membrane protease YdiL (CAAX protease family)
LQEFNPGENQEQKQPGSGFFRNLNPFAYVIIVLAVVFFLYQFIGGLLALAAGDLDLENPNVKITRIILSFGQFMFILAPTIFFARLQTSDLKGLFRLKAPKASLVLLAIAGIVLIQPFLQGYMYLQEEIFNSIPFINDVLKPVKEIFESLEKSTLKIVAAHSIAEFLVVVFVICVTPAICEEVLFRGFTLGNLTKAAKPAAAIFLSGFLFAFYHFQPLNIVPLIILGWYLGFIVYYANSIWVGVICHFLNNFFAAYFLYAYGKQDFETPNLTGDELTSTIAAGTVSFLLFVSVILLYYRQRTGRSGESVSS